MMSRRIIVGAVSTAVLFGILPASSAQAQDDLICARSDTRLISHTSAGEMQTTVVGYCAEWVWRPGGVSRPTDGTKRDENDPDGGKGGTPEDRETCDSLKAELKNIAEQLDLFDTEIPAAEAALIRQQFQAGKDYVAREYSRQDWIDAQHNTDEQKALYLLLNDLDAEIVYSPKAGVTITRAPSLYHINTSLPAGATFQAAVNAEARAKAAHLDADDTWRLSNEKLETMQAQVDDLRSRRAALLQAIERIQGQLSGCK